MALEPLLSEDQIQARIAEMGARIRADYGSETILLVGVLKGCVYFLADLSRSLGGEQEVDFVQVSSYANGRESSGIVQIRKDLDLNIEGRSVLVVEDIVDTGATLRHLRDLLGTRRPASLKVVSLLSKLAPEESKSLIEYVGFTIPNEFVVGYGLDHAERYRNLRHIAILREDQSSA
jgi:hypoxanthine phosphoribosyltransferase